MKPILIILACAFLFVGCDKLLGQKEEKPDPKIESHCVMNGYGSGKCSFTNKGGPGSQCIKVTVFKVADMEKTVSSSTICSGSVGTRETKSKAFSIPGVNDLCSESGVAWNKVCAFRVTNDD
jgi:hypothetical protein